MAKINNFDTENSIAQRQQSRTLQRYTTRCLHGLVDQDVNNSVRWQTASQHKAEELNVSSYYAFPASHFANKRQLDIRKSYRAWLPGTLCVCVDVSSIEQSSDGAMNLSCY